MDIDSVIALEQIRSNIDKFGHHIYLVQQSNVPRFAYTIGLGSQIGAELLFAGGNYFMADEVFRIINATASALKVGRKTQDFTFDELGKFSVASVHQSWSRMLLLGALKYFKLEAVRALQIVPDKEHLTIDVPDCQIEWDALSDPIWQWLGSAWTLSIPSESTAVTDIDALRGEQIVMAARWETDQWEMFSAPANQFSPDQIRIVPIGTLLAFDASLIPVIELEVGQGLLRDIDDQQWTKW